MTSVNPFIKKITTSSLSDPEVIDSLRALIHAKTFVAIAFKGLNCIDSNEWYQFMDKYFVNDKRQFDFDEVLQIATWWEISNQPDKETSYAFSKTPQPFHTDNAWFADPAEINLFYMKKQASSGGEQIFYPVDRLIDDIQAEEPGLFADLASIPVTINKGDTVYKNKRTILDIKDGGAIYWNFYRTDKSNKSINKMCVNFFDYLSAKLASNSVFSVRLESGEALAFNDQRTLHARNSFVATKPRDRILFQSMWSI